MLTGTKTQTVCQFFTYFPLTNTTHTEIIKKTKQANMFKTKKKGEKISYKSTITLDDSSPCPRFLPMNFIFFY